MNLINQNRKRKSKIDFELYKRLNEYYANPDNIKKRKEEENKGKVPKGKQISNKEHDKYEYFFAGENEYNIYKKFVEKNFYKKQKSGLQTLEDLAKPELKDKLFRGSSPKINCAMNMALRDKGIHVVTQSQLEYVFQNNLLSLSGVYSDTGMCLRSDSGANENYAKDLINQLGEQELPVYLPVISYDLIKNKNELGFKVIDKSKIIYLPILNSPNQSKFDNSDIDLSTGFPIKLNENGARTFYTRQDGLSSCCLDWGSNLGSGDSILSNSLDSGRVVLAKSRSDAFVESTKFLKNF